MFVGQWGTVKETFAIYDVYKNSLSRRQPVCHCMLAIIVDSSTSSVVSCSFRRNMFVPMVSQLLHAIVGI